MTQRTIAAMPTPTPGLKKAAFSLQMTMSLSATSMSPPPPTMPLTAQITGLRTPFCHGEALTPGASGSRFSPAALRSAVSFTSTPAQKALSPTAVRIATRRARSFWKSSQISAIS